MLFALLFLTLPAETQYPEPYLGASMGLALDKAAYQKYIHVGLPFEFSRINYWYYPKVRWMALPEVFFSPKMLAIILGAGPEADWSTGFRQNPSAFFAGLQGGLYLAGETNSGALLGRTSVAAMINGYFGPRFKITNNRSVKLQIDLKMMFGKIASQTIRSQFSNYIGWSLGLNLQFQPFPVVN